MRRLILFITVGDGGKKKEGGADHTLVPATHEPTLRAYRYVKHVHRHEVHELQWPGSRD